MDVEDMDLHTWLCTQVVTIDILMTWSLRFEQMKRFHMHH